MRCELGRKQHNRADLFYNEWYASGYMDEWPDDKKARTLEIIKTLNLQETGDALDYGCGNGVFTAVLKRALPNWNVYGIDISSVAIDNARNRYPDCSFLLPTDIRLINKTFDFLFSHHVLEHVEDIDEVWSTFDQLLKEQSSCLHILPCGNQGSLEYNVCMLKEDGIDRSSGNRFFFEDKSHLRRLTTNQMNDLSIRHNFELVSDYYSNQFYGALDWITLSSPEFILKLTNLTKARDLNSALKLMSMRILLLLIKFIRFPANTIDYKRNRLKGSRYCFLFLVLFPFYPFSKLANIFLQLKSNSEWSDERRKNNGSEMYLHYARHHTHGKE